MELLNHWVATADDPTTAHLAKQGSLMALCAVQADGEHPSPDPAREDRCNACELQDMAARGLIRIKGLRQGTLAAF